MQREDSKLLALIENYFACKPEKRLQNVYFVNWRFLVKNSLTLPWHCQHNIPYRSSCKPSNNIYRRNCRVIMSHLDSSGVKIIRTVAALGGKAFSSSAMVIMLLFTAELYPTILRSVPHSYNVSVLCTQVKMMFAVFLWVYIQTGPAEKICLATMRIERILLGC